MDAVVEFINNSEYTEHGQVKHIRIQNYIMWFVIFIGFPKLAVYQAY